MDRHVEVDMPNAHLSVHPRVLTFAARLTPDIGLLVDQLDRLGVRQTVVTGRTLGAYARAAVGAHGTVRRIGVPLRERTGLLHVAAAARLPLLGRRADVIHVHAEEEVDLALALATAGMWAIPVVVSAVPRPDPVSPGRPFMDGLRRALRSTALRHAGAVLVANREEAEWATTAGAPPQRLHVLGTALEPEQRASAILESYRAVWARHLARQVAVWHPTPG